MAKNLHPRQINSRNTDTPKLSEMDDNELKTLVRDGMVAMNMSEREEFIGTLEAEMRRSGLDLRAYLVPLGIPARSPEDLTPTEVAHVVRFLKLNVQKAMAAVERAVARYAIFGDNNRKNGHRIAA